jgi:hypothetical protein
MSNAETMNIDPAVCPLCGHGNNCAMAYPGAVAADVKPCWCLDATFSAALIARVPKELRDRACICKTCSESAPAL